MGIWDWINLGLSEGTHGRACGQASVVLGNSITGNLADQYTHCFGNDSKFVADPVGIVEGIIASTAGTNHPLTIPVTATVMGVLFGGTGATDLRLGPTTEHKYLGPFFTVERGPAIKRRSGNSFWKTNERGGATNDPAQAVLQKLTTFYETFAEKIEWLEDMELRYDAEGAEADVREATDDMPARAKDKCDVKCAAIGFALALLALVAALIIDAILFGVYNKSSQGVADYASSVDSKASLASSGKTAGFLSAAFIPTRLIGLSRAVELFGWYGTEVYTSVNVSKRQLKTILERVQERFTIDGPPRDQLTVVVQRAIRRRLQRVT